MGRNDFTMIVRDLMLYPKAEICADDDLRLSPCMFIKIVGPGIIKTNTGFVGIAEYNSFRSSYFWSSGAFMHRASLYKKVLYFGRLASKNNKPYMILDSNDQKAEMLSQGSDHLKWERGESNPINFIYHWGNNGIKLEITKLEATAPRPAFSGVLTSWIDDEVFSGFVSENVTIGEDKNYPE